MSGFLFWSLVSYTLYVYFGYPFVLLIISRIKKLRVRVMLEMAPSVTLIVAAHNEEKVINEKIENCLDLDYPEDKLEIIVASDASTDGTNEIVREYVKHRFSQCYLAII